jgi:hypothetical protein
LVDGAPVMQEGALGGGHAPGSSGIYIYWYIYIGIYTYTYIYIYINTYVYGHMYMDTCIHVYVIKRGVVPLYGMVD